MNWNKYINKYDTERYGYKVISINDYCFKESDFKSMNDIKLIMLRVTNTDFNKINYLEGLGFEIKDIICLLTNSRTITTHIPNLFKIKIRDYQDHDKEDILKIASTSFIGLGHYFSEQKFDIEKSKTIHLNWTQDSLTDENIITFVADKDGEVVGYATTRKGENHISVELLAVDKNYYGYMIAPLLINEISKSNLRQEYGVHFNNYRMINTLIKLGFIIEKNTITLHKWL